MSEMSHGRRSGTTHTWFSGTSVSGSFGGRADGLLSATSELWSVSRRPASRSQTPLTQFSGGRAGTHRSRI
jgi:hypothetical protein